MCEQRERLIGYVYDECDTTERRVVEQHLETCPTCRSEIRGLRSVRQDLLAWEVPEHDPIWRPIAPVRVESAWKTMPAWAMATAAAALLMAGGAGGAATYALFPRPAAPVESVRAATAGEAANSTSTSQAALIAAFAQRLNKLEQANASGEPRLVSAQPAAVAPDMTRINAAVNRLATQVGDLSDRQMQMSNVLVEVTRQAVDLRGGLQGLKRDNDNFARQVSFSQNPMGGR